MKYLKYIFVICAICFSLALGGCASCTRSMKTMESDFSGGINRTVTLYDYNGNKINEWSGKIDIQPNSQNEEVLFDLNDKRTILHGGIVIIQEV